MDEGSIPSDSTTRDKLIFFEICPFLFSSNSLSICKIYLNTSLILVVRHFFPWFNTIHDRDESNYALKEALVEVKKYKILPKIVRLHSLLLHFLFPKIIFYSWEYFFLLISKQSIKLLNFKKNITFNYIWWSIFEGWKKKLS